VCYAREEPSDHLLSVISWQSTKQDCNPMAHFLDTALPPLVDLIDSLDYAMYHLDGTGALSHLDTLLGIKNLRAIQWVPGSGHESVSQWYDLIRHILSRGKSVEVFAGMDEVDDLAKNVGTRGLLIYTGVSSPDEAASLLEKYPQEV